MTASGETYGQKFRRLRKELGWSQPMAAQRCGVSLPTVAHWEADTRQFNSREQSALIRHSIARLKRSLYDKKRRGE